MSYHPLSQIARDTIEKNPSEGKSEINLSDEATVITRFDAYVWCLSSDCNSDVLLSFAHQGASLYDACIKVRDFEYVSSFIATNDLRLGATDSITGHVAYGPVERRVDEDGVHPIGRLLQKPISNDKVRYESQREIRAVFYSPGKLPDELPILDRPFSHPYLRRFFESVDITNIHAEAQARLSARL